MLVKDSKIFLELFGRIYSDAKLYIQVSLKNL